eukprot:6550137-Prymnesium_polylepis.1
MDVIFEIGCGGEGGEAVEGPRGGRGVGVSQVRRRCQSQKAMADDGARRSPTPGFAGVAGRGRRVPPR